MFFGLANSEENNLLKRLGGLDYCSQVINLIYLEAHRNNFNTVSVTPAQ